MNEALDRRVAALTGLALAGAVAWWWLGSTRIALDRASDAGRVAADALQALWLVRGMALAVLGVRSGALRGWRSGMEAQWLLVVPAWPVVVLVWSASTVPLPLAAGVELLLMAASVVLPLMGQGLRRALRRAEPAEVIATAIGLAMACSAWLTRDLWVLTLR
ncbi:MAG: hypothetical protein Q7T97_01325 [Burkholderiaceae bacterium]|nr:hypothetical protein [Burkholderiaceae bacterium]